jgi:L-lysine exporter family protein LysE/ArgO
VLAAFATGFGTGFSLILAIGAQNAFVLRQGLMRAHVLAVCLVCAVSDAVLIAAGVAGMGTLAGLAPWLIDALTWGGAAFLIVYGALSLRRAFRPAGLRAAASGATSLGAALGTAMAFTWLNPHVYLDTVALIGAVSTEFVGRAPMTAFAAGAVTASFVFFFGLGYGARLLAPVFERPRAWAVLNTAIALVMWSIALSLLLA